jgi:hypothetical protein
VRPLSQRLRPHPRGLPPLHGLVIDRKGAHQYREWEKVEQRVRRWLACGEEEVVALEGRRCYLFALNRVRGLAVGRLSGVKSSRRRGRMKGKDGRGTSVVVATLGQHVTHPRELDVSSIPIASSTRPNSLPLSLLLPPQVHGILRGVLLNQISPAHYTARECVCGEELDEVIKILIVYPIFTAEVVFHTNGECLEEVDDRLFFDEDFGFDDVRGRLVVGYSIYSTRVRKNSERKSRREEEIDGR